MSVRKTERLDQILVRLGHVSAAQVEEAYRRQQVEGGRIGRKLVETGALSEEQLFDGLVEQFRIPTVTVSESEVVRDLVERVPVHVLERGLVVPIAWNEDAGVLSIAAANPSDVEGIKAVGSAFGARKVRVSLAPESVLARLLERVKSEDPEGDGDQVNLVALPELFEPASEEPDAPPPTEREGGRPVVMVTSGAVRRNFLPAVVGPEGIDLTVVEEAQDLADAVKAGVEAVLVDDGMEADVLGWIASGAVPRPGCGVTVFRSIGAALLDNPVPYPEVADSLRQAVQSIAEYRTRGRASPPPYGLMASDLERLSERLGLVRLARDGLNVGLHLLTPVEAGTSIDPFEAFEESIQLVHRLRFPWPLERMLGSCLELYLGRAQPAAERDPQDVGIAAQLLALVWYRHVLLGVADDVAPPADGDAEDSRVDLRASMRALAGRFASLDVVETYLDLMEERTGDRADEKKWRVLVVGDERTEASLAPAFTRAGAEVALAASADDEAAASGVDAAILDHRSLAEELAPACRTFAARYLPVFVLAEKSDPALVLNLLDVGAHDVFGPPHEPDVVAARVLRAVRARASAAGSASEGQFSAKFDAFAFLDLAQMLANGLRTARVDLRGGTGEEAVLYLVNGRPVHAAVGEVTGPAAVYRIITWEDDGEFTVDEIDDLPPANIEESMESLLMEGVRLLDESRA